MFVLDTNVFSELIQPSPAPAVYDWVHSKEKTSLFFTTVSEAELRRGLALKPAGRSRDALAARIEDLLGTFVGRILPFDRKAAAIFGQLAAQRQAAGLSFAPLDVMIAAIASSRGMAVATRNVKDYLNALNPWDFYKSQDNPCNN